MRKYYILAAILFISPMTSRAIEPISMTLATSIAIPLIKAAWDAFAHTEPKSCNPECYQGGRYCSKGIRYKNYRDCKGICQQILQYGDYQLRVRFTQDDKSVKSLLHCVQTGNYASGRDPLGKDKDKRAVVLKKSIAVYNPTDLQTALGLIMKHRAAKIIEVSDAQFLIKEYQDAIEESKPEDLNPTDYVSKAKKDAKETMAILEKQIEALRTAGIFGPQ